MKVATLVLFHDSCGRVGAVHIVTGWAVRGSNPVVGRFSVPLKTGPEAHPASCTMGTGNKATGAWS